MRGPRDPRALVTGAHVHPDAERHRSHRRHTFGDHPQPGPVRGPVQLRGRPAARGPAGRHSDVPAFPALATPVAVAPAWPEPAVPAAVSTPVAVTALAGRPALVALVTRPAALRRVPALAHGLQADLAGRVDLLHLHHQLVADVHGLLHGGDPLAPAQLRDVHQAVAPWQDVDERPEGGGLDHGALVALADFGKLRVDQGVDHLPGLLRPVALARPDEHRAVVLDVDVCPGDGDDLVDPLALRPDDLADLVHGDLDHDHPRGLRAQHLPRLGDGPGHRLEDEQTGLLRLLEGPGQDLGGEATDLGVELER